MLSSSRPYPPALMELTDQPRVQAYLSQAWQNEQLSHAYLVVGAPGSDKHLVARALAQCCIADPAEILDQKELQAVVRDQHPDVQRLQPESVQGYLIGQIRELIYQCSLAPIRARKKVYILEQAGLLQGSAANAFLKTLEEPPSNVVFVLIARSAMQLLPTILSRVQQIPCTALKFESQLEKLQQAGVMMNDEAHIALALTGSRERAQQFLASDARQQARRLIIQTLNRIPESDDWDLLCCVRDLLDLARIPQEELEKEQAVQSDVYKDFLSAGAMKKLTDTHKRELTARERSSIMELLAVVESVFRDVLLICTTQVAREQTNSAEFPAACALVNIDSLAVLDHLAAAFDVAGILRALEACRKTAAALRHSVSPQLALEVMLIHIKEAVTCPPLFR